MSCSVALFSLSSHRFEVETVTEGCSKCSGSPFTGEVREVGRGGRVQRWISRSLSSFSKTKRSAGSSWGINTLTVSIESKTPVWWFVIDIFTITQPAAAALWGWLAWHGRLQNQRSIFLQRPSLCVNAQNGGWWDFCIGSLRKAGWMAWWAQRSAVWKKIHHLRKVK